MAIGTIAGVSKYYGDISVIWIDAHTDINTEETTPSGNIHGMPLAASMNQGNSLLTNIYYDGIKVKPENVYIIGARSIDEGEYEIAKKLKLNLYTMTDVRDQGITTVLNSIIEKIKKSNTTNVHLSFDIDCIDKDFVPGCNTPVENGFTVTEVKQILTNLFEQKFIKAMDFVELNPLKDMDELTVNNCIDVIKHVFSLF